jgi:hypothetical protein
LFSENRLEKYGGSLVQSSWSPEKLASVVPCRQKRATGWLSGGYQNGGKAYPVAPKHSKGSRLKSLRRESAGEPRSVYAPEDVPMLMNKAQPLSWWGALNEELNAM